MKCPKSQNELFSFPRQTFQYHSIQVYVLTSNTEEAEVKQFYEDIRDLLELTPRKHAFFHYRGLECKSRKSRDTWSNTNLVIEYKMKQIKG